LIPAFEGSNPSSPSIFHYEVARALLGSDAQKCRKRQVPLAHAMRNNLLAGHSPLGTDASRRPFALETKDAWGPVVAVARARQQPLTTAPRSASSPRSRTTSDESCCGTSWMVASDRTSPACRRSVSPLGHELCAAVSKGPVRVVVLDDRHDDVVRRDSAWGAKRTINLIPPTS
jgi:hypothetical protein